MRFFSFITICIIFSGFTSDQKTITNRYKKINYVQVSNEIFIDQTEVTVYDWLVFMSDIENTTDFYFGFNLIMPELSKVNPKSKIYFQHFYDNEKTYSNVPPLPNRRIVFDENVNLIDIKKHNTLNNIKAWQVPITGITYDQVKLYCKWRTKRLNTAFDNRKLNYPKNYRDKRFNIRLISPKEFEKYSSLYKYYGKSSNISSVNFKINNNPDSLNCDTCLLFNYKRTFYTHIDKLFPKSTYPVALFFSDFLTIYDWYGNVAEMSSIEGVSKGGSFIHYAYEAYPKNDIRYNQAEKWLGFRTVIEFK